MTVASTLPSDCWNAPAIPHMTSPPRGRRDGCHGDRATPRARRTPGRTRPSGDPRPARSPPAADLGGPSPAAGPARSRRSTIARAKASTSPGVDVDGGDGGRHPGLLEVEGDHRQAERHVLHRLVHRRDVVERVQRVRAQPQRRGREHLGDGLVGDPAGHVDVVGEPELGHARRTRSRSSRPAPMSVKAMSSRPHVFTMRSAAASDEVDAVLRPHHSEVGHEVAPAPTKGRDLGRLGGASSGRARSARP